MDKANTIKIENWTDIEELVAMSIGTNKGQYWADKSFGSELWILKQTGKVDDSTAGKVRSMILDSLAWLQADGIAKEIKCESERIGKNQIRYIVTVYRPSGDTVTVKDVWNGID